jgi:hypothetical protein
MAMHPDAPYFIILLCLTPDNFNRQGGGSAATQWVNLDCHLCVIGRCGILQCPSGLQVAYVSGIDSNKSSKVKKIVLFLGLGMFNCILKSIFVYIT